MRKKDTRRKIDKEQRSKPQHFGLIKTMMFASLQILAFTSIKYVFAADCFPKSESLFPKILMKQSGHTGDLKIGYNTVLTD